MVLFIDLYDCLLEFFLFVSMKLIILADFKILYLKFLKNNSLKMYVYLIFPSLPFLLLNMNV